MRALCFIVDRGHAQYAGRLPLAERVHHVRQGHGSSGPNRDYVIETVRALEALGYRETDLHLIAEQTQGNQQSEPSGPIASAAFASATSRAVASSNTLCSRDSELAPFEPRRNRIEHLDQHRAGIAPQRPARPEQSGIERDRHAGSPVSV